MTFCSAEVKKLSISCCCVAGFCAGTYCGTGPVGMVAFWLVSWTCCCFGGEEEDDEYDGTEPVLSVGTIAPVEVLKPEEEEEVAGEESS